jgi:hypothetical protein
MYEYFISLTSLYKIVVYIIELMIIIEEDVLLL